MGKKRHSVWIIGIMVLTILLLVNAAGAASFEYWNETPDGIENRAIIQLYDAPVLSYAAVLQSKLMLKQEEIDKLEKELAIDTGNKFLQSQLMDARTEFENEKILIDAKIITYRDNIFNIHSNIKNEIAQNNLEIKILREYAGIFNGFAVEASKENIEKLKNIPYIKTVYPDKKVQAFLEDSVPLINATAVWQIQNVSGINITGKNVRVAVIDTGIDYNHPDLGGGFGPGYRVIAGWDVFNNDSDPIDDHGHGTHVAGIVAANGSIKGVAPDAQLMAYKVLSAGGWGWWSDVIDGIERAVDPDENPITDDGADIISMSLGGWGNPDDPVSQSVDNADAAGVLVVVAAGNSGPYNNSIGSPGTARKALTVGATTKSDEIASFSSRGPVTWANGSMIKPEVVAPGVLINSTITNMSTPLGSPTGYRKLSGTSMATPHVSGAAALLLQLHPDWTPEKLKSALVTTAVDLNYDVYTQGAGRIDVLKAAGVEALVNQSILSLGIVNTRDEFWQVERNINLRNIAGVSKSFNISVVMPYYSGVTANLSQTNVSLNSGASTVFNFSMTVNNSVVSAGNYEGDIIIKSDTNVLRIPFAFIKPPASLNDIYKDYGIDTDGNGLYDYLAVDVGVDVAKSGYYRVIVDLHSSDNYHLTENSTYRYLSAGRQNVTVLLDGMDIRRNRINGSYVLDDVWLLDGNWNLVDVRDDPYTTNYYNYTDFQRPPAELVPGINDFGLDTNSNGLYDYLVVEKPVNVTSAGYYEVDGYLYNSSGYYIGSAYNYTYLSAGLHNITLKFDGWKIYRSENTGNFTVYSYLYGYSMYGMSVSPVSENVKEVSERLPKTPDKETADITHGSKFSKEKLSVEKNTIEHKPLAVSPQIVPPPYYIWRFFDSMRDNTSYYTYTQFERPPAKFNDIYSDYGLDTDSNGYYDYLVIDVGVNVSKTGYYYVSGYLYNSSGWYIDGNGTYAYLYPGNQTVQLIFNGARIWQYRTNDTFDLKYLGLYNVSGWWWDELDYRYDAYTTKLYNYTDFRPQAFFMPGINDYGLDENANGLYDYLVVEKQVNVTTAGNYEIDSYLYNSSGYYIGSVYNYTYLSAGVHNIAMRFSGVRIYRSESEGNFTVYSYLYGYSSTYSLASENIKEDSAKPPEKEKLSLEKDIIEPKTSDKEPKPLSISQQDVGATWWRWFDSAIDTTNYYTYTQFERPPAKFNDIYSDYGLDTDSNGYYDYLVIDVGVNVSKTGYYYVSGYLYNSSGWYIDGNGTYAYLYPGNQTVQLIFNGARIWQYRTNDTFDLKYLGLYNVSGWWWDELDYIYDAYTTKLYNYTDFRPQAFFMPGINDYGLDTNSNGLYDYLVVEKPVNVTSAGYYEVDGYLYNSSGYYIGSAYNYTYLSSGIYNITLKFDGWKIYRSESTGNFTVYSYLYGYSNSAILPTPTVTPYPANIKEKTPEKPENFPDIERISAEKDVIEPKLTENMDINISALKPLAISQEQTGVTWWRWFDSAIDTTRNYTYTQFERPPARFNDVYSDYGLDTDSNGLYDYITIDVGVNVSKTGYYYVSGSLYNSSGWYIGSASNYINLNPGNQTVQLRFDGARIWQYRTNGTFDLKYLSLYNTSNWNELDYRHYAYTTKAYNYTDFRPQAVFMPGIKDYGLDENNNSLYDYLVVEKQVNVTVAGSYEVDGYLYNPSGNYIGSAYNSTNLNAGLQNITLRFDSVRIYRSNSTGNFTVYTYLYGYSSSGLSASTKSENTEKLPVEKIIEKTILEQKLSENISSNASAFKPLAISQEQVGATWWRWFDSAIDTTKYYTYTQFERPPARFSDIYSDYGLDTDSNGFYDYLVINVGVNVSRKGYYYVSGSLYDSSGWYWIGSASNYTKLKAGNNTLQLRFNGANIWQYRINGTFDLKYLYLYNASGWWEQLDYRYHAYTTKYYNYPDFDYPGRPDAYEPDDNYSNATYISTDGTKQTHNFHTPGDRDWMKFNATAGSSYILETSEPGLDSDTYMYLYAPELTEIAHDDDSGEGLASRIIWTGNTTDAYYIMVRHFSASVYGRNTHYNISVRANYTDIISYYRSLGSNPNVVETTDLLKAADDWSRDIAPPGFGVPITTVQLLALADEWSRS